MAGPIQLIPPGLLGFFQLKNDGRNPRDLLETVQPTLEMRDWYQLIAQTSWNGAVGSTMTVSTAGASGFKSWTGGGGAIVVPAQQVWWVRSYGIGGAIAVAGDAIRLRGAYRANRNGPGSGGDFGLDSGVAPTGTQNNSLRLGYHNFWLLPGQELGVQVEDIVSPAGFNLQGYLEYTPLPI